MRWLIVLGMALFSSRAYTQNIGEWFQQQQTQFTYLAEQIAAMKVYAGYVEKGYAVFRDGWEVVNDMKNGEFSLHKDYFSGLYQVKPVVRSTWKVAAIGKSAGKIMRLYQQSSARLRRYDTFKKEEKDFIQNTWQELLRQVAAALAELKDVTLSTGVSISDKGRLRRVDMLCRQFEDLEIFAIELQASSEGLHNNTRLTKLQIDVVKRLYNK